MHRLIRGMILVANITGSHDSYWFSAICFNALFMSSKFCLTAVSSHPSSDATIEPVNFSLWVKCTLLLLLSIGSIRKRCSPLNISPSDLPSHLSSLSLSATNTSGVWAGAIWIAWAVMFYVAGALSGFLFTSSSLPTQPIGSLLMAISGGWIVWSALRQRSPAALQQQEA